MKKLLLVVLAMFSIPSKAADCVTVQGDRISGADLAAANPAFQGIDPAADIGPAPAAGARRTFRYYELEKIATDHQVAFSKDASREACVERATMALNEPQLRAVLSAVLASEARTAEAKLEIVDFSRNPLPVGAPEFTLDGLSDSGLWRGRILYGDNRSVPVWARVRVTGTKDKTPIASWRKVEAPEILRGDTVQVEVTSGKVRLSFEAAAESSGHVGEQVTVRNPENGQRFRAVVESAGRVGIHK